MRSLKCLNTEHAIHHDESLRLTQMRNKLQLARKRTEGIVSVI